MAFLKPAGKGKVEDLDLDSTAGYIAVFSQSFGERRHDGGIRGVMANRAVARGA